MTTDHAPAGHSRISTSMLIALATGALAILVAALLAVSASSNPDPTAVAPGDQSLVTSIVNASVIVFREGLEAVLIMAALTASLLGGRRSFRRPIIHGVAAAFAVSIASWFALTALLDALPVSRDMLLAITGIAAVAVLLLVMNWFFHRVYWTDHIRDLNSRKRGLVRNAEAAGSDSRAAHAAYWGFFALGFSAVVREGLEVVLFLQNLHVVAGGTAVLGGVAIGLAATAACGVLTFVAHHKLPYKRMLILTGVLLGIVLVVMVGGSARTLQSLGVLSTTPLPFGLPDWFARWFEIVPTYETIGIQFIAALFVLGSYWAAEWWAKEKRRRARERGLCDQGDITPEAVIETGPRHAQLLEEARDGAPAQHHARNRDAATPGGSREPAQ